MFLFGSDAESLGYIDALPEANAGRARITLTNGNIGEAPSQEGVQQPAFTLRGHSREPSAESTHDLWGREYAAFLAENETSLGTQSAQRLGTNPVLIDATYVHDPDSGNIRFQLEDGSRRRIVVSGFNAARLDYHNILPNEGLGRMRIALSPTGEIIDAPPQEGISQPRLRIWHTPEPSGNSQPITNSSMYDNSDPDRSLAFWPPQPGDSEYQTRIQTLPLYRHSRENSRATTNSGGAHLRVPSTEPPAYLTYAPGAMLTPQPPEAAPTISVTPTDDDEITYRTGRTGDFSPNPPERPGSTSNYQATYVTDGENVIITYGGNHHHQAGLSNETAQRLGYNINRAFGRLAITLGEDGRLLPHAPEQTLTLTPTNTR